MRKSNAPSSLAKRSRTATRKPVSRSKIPRAIVSIGKQTFPNQLRNTIVYGEMQTISVTAFTNYVWSANGLYDPNITGTGHQPRGFDELCSLYNHYAVTACRAKFWTASADVRNLLVSVTVDDDGTLPGTGVPDQLENGASFKSYCPSVSEAKPVYVKWNAKNIFGTNGLINPNLQGDSGHNPLEQTYFNVCVRDLNGVVANNINILARLEYDVIWSERTSLAQS